MAQKIILPVVILLLIAVAGYYFIVVNRTVEKGVHETVLQEREALQQKAEELEGKVALLEKEISETEPVVDNETLREAFGEVPADDWMQEQPVESTSTKITNFFSHLDRKGYLQESGINMDADSYFRNIVDRLTKTSPVVSGETKDLYTLLKNITYFFRMLGKTDLQVIKRIVEGEAEIIEPTMKLFFEWISPWNRNADSDRPLVAPELLYEYAGFFLHTIAGQAYLFRRDSRVRYLTSYYCILILDASNEQDLNKYGIDIRPHVNALINDMQSHKKIANRIDYLSRLQSIQNKYPR